MISWLFDPRPMVEWMIPKAKGVDPATHQGHLVSRPVPQPTDPRFPSDSIVHYRMYRDPCGRESKVGYLEYGPKPRLSAQLVETCWVNGVPLILWFQEAPSWDAPFWRETLSCRSIQTMDTGRLRWQPIVSWFCDRLEGATEELAEWLNQGLPFFPQPILRFEFAEEIPFEAIGETLLELAAAPLPCRFKLFALAESHRDRIHPEQWVEILKGFQDPHPNEKNLNPVIPLYPEK